VLAWVRLPPNLRKARQRPPTLPGARRRPLHLQPSCLSHRWPAVRPPPSPVRL